jgi:hypothetical protein
MLLAQVVTFCFAIGLAEGPTKPGSAALACARTQADCEKVRTEALKDASVIAGPCSARDPDGVGQLLLNCGPNKGCKPPDRK